MADPRLTGIQGAVERLHNPKTDWNKFNKTEDQKNINHAMESGLIKRDGDGFLIYQDPTKAGQSINMEKVVTGSGINDWQNSSKMLDKLEGYIKKKQEILQPTSEEERMWRGMIKDTTPFGAVRDNTFYETVPRGASFDSANLRELSPSDQASVRASRDAAAQAHLGGIASEREYIGAQASDAISSMASMINEKMDLEAQRLKAAAASSGTSKSIFTNTDKKKISNTLGIPVSTIQGLSDDDLSDLYAVVDSDIVKNIEYAPFSDNQKRALIDGYVSDASGNELGNLISAMDSASPKASNVFKSNIGLLDNSSSSSEPLVQRIEGLGDGQDPNYQSRLDNEYLYKKN